MAPPHNRRHKQIEFEIGVGNRFECQISNWTLDPGEQDGDYMFTLCPDGEFTEETDPQATLAITYFADWRSGGLSDYLWANRGTVAAVRIRQHPQLVGETVQFAGSLRLKAPPTGGEARSTETQEVTFQVTAVTYARI